jgi:hypothetical protein
MKQLFSNWRVFLKEGYVKYSGILKMRPDAETLAELEVLQNQVPEDAVRLNIEDLHLTLVHQSILKPFRKQLKNMEFPDPPKIILGDKVYEKTSPEKKSWAVDLINQDEMKKYVNQVMSLLGSENINPEPDRIFHISLGNLTGDPHDSVR